MSETPPNDNQANDNQQGNGLPRDPVDEPGFSGAESERLSEIEPAQPARAASVQLRDQSDSESAMMDPANQSLADALRITFVLVQVAMVVLAGLFVFSGFQTIREGERGLSLLFGKANRVNLEPGFHFSAPYPFGELVKVGTGNESVKLLREFWPYVAPGNEEDSIERLSANRQLNPSRDGSLITADLNLAHTQWQAVYRRTNPTEFVQNILPENEEEIVRAALSRGVVRTMATVSIDDLLKPQAGGTRAISQQAQEIAQTTLDAIGAGITIEQFEMSQKTPPISLLSRFQAVLDARSDAQEAISEARTTRDTSMNETAGEAAAGLLWLIAQYELEIEKGERDAAADVLARIDAVLAGEAVELSDEEIAQSRDLGGFAGLARANGKRASGQVVEIIQTADVERLTTVQSARSDLELYNAKLEQFRANPTVMPYRDWASAWSSFQENDFVQTMMLPVKDGAVELWLNQDPSIVKDLDRAFKQRQRIEAAAERFREQQRRQYQGERGKIVEDK
mgnify:CR=1 FL=1